MWLNVCYFTVFPLLGLFGFYLATHGDGLTAKLGIALMAVALTWIVSVFFLPLVWTVVQRL